MPHPDNPFLNTHVPGHGWMGDPTATGRMRAVEHFDLPTCRKALKVPDLQATVVKALERRIRKLEKLMEA